MESSNVTKSGAAALGRLDGKSSLSRSARSRAWSAAEESGAWSAVTSEGSVRALQEKPGPAAPPPPVVTFGSRLSSCSRSMCDTFELLRRFAATDVTVTLLGETGAGKDVLAHALHEESARATGPFVIFDCASVAANLAESELLGHERGAFTGADFAHAGAFERADGGTLFLDEFAELPIDIQPRLLRALESRRVRRVGGKHERDVDVRIVAATNRDLRADVSGGKFREDLYFRLAAAVVPVPPLRDRLDDLPLLVASIFDRLGRGDVRLSDDALATLRAHPWQGNVRELKNVLSCAAAFLDAGAHLIETRHLRTMAPRGEQESPLDRYSLAGRALEDIERVAIMQTMASSAGNKVSAAHTLGIAVSTLYKKLKKYSL